MNTENLNSFLKFGYFLDYEPSLALDLRKRPKKYGGDYFDALIQAKELWLSCFEKQWKAGTNVVPLSGGLDSRILLGTLLHFDAAKNIKTLTYGTKGTWDVTIPEKISKWAGTRHAFIDMSDGPVLDLDALIKTSQRFDNQTMLFYHPPFDKIDLEVNNSNVWNGVLIDVIMGKHGFSKKTISRDASIQKFEAKNTLGNAILFEGDIDRSLYALVDGDCGYPEEYSIDLLNRQLKLVVPHVMPKGYKWCHMIDTDLVEFLFSLPTEWHQGQRFYLDLARLIIPNEFFDFPSTTFLGASISSTRLMKKYRRLLFSVHNRTDWVLKGGLDLGMNYFGTSELINNDGFIRLAKEQMSDLSKRSIVAKELTELVLKEISTGNGRFISEAIILTSLEIHHKANPQMKQLYG